jgi:hypothetical protein
LVDGATADQRYIYRAALKFPNQFVNEDFRAPGLRVGQIFPSEKKKASDRTLLDATLNLALWIAHHLIISQIDHSGGSRQSPRIRLKVVRDSPQSSKISFQRAP